MTEECKWTHISAEEMIERMEKFSKNYKIGYNVPSSMKFKKGEHKNENILKLFGLVDD